jgi:hypothetical protein
MRAPALITALSVTLVLSQGAPANAQDAIQPTDPSLATHCLSSNPARLALTDDQIARIQAIRHDHPEDTAERRAAILKVLTQTQRMVFWRMAGIAAC